MDEYSIVDENITPEELERRLNIDRQLETTLRHYNSLFVNRPSSARQRLLGQYVRVPEVPTNTTNNRTGEVLVNFYNHVLPCTGDTQSTEKSTWLSVPLQYLYRRTEADELEMVDRSTLLAYLPETTRDSEHLRVIEFSTLYYANDFLKAMKGVTLRRLIIDAKSEMTVLRTDRQSKFLTGVCHYPKLHKKLVSKPTKIGHGPETLLFIAMPYLGQEPEQTASYRRAAQSLGEERDLLEGGVGRLTAHYLVNNTEKEINSSLSLFEYKFPTQANTTALSKHQVNMGGEEIEWIAVHQVWLVVLDNDTIAVFRSSAEVQSEHHPILPYHFENVKGYHAVLNMISNILSTSENEIAHKLSQQFSDLEFLLENRSPFGSDLKSRQQIVELKTLKLECSAIIKVIDAQDGVIESLGAFMKNKDPEQFKSVTWVIDLLNESRKAFRKRIRITLEEVQVLHEALHQQLLQETNMGRLANHIAEVQEFAADSMIKQLIEQRKTTEDALVHQQKLATQQQETKLTVFTVVSTIFLPLSFLTSYYAMNIPDNPALKMTQSEFWGIAAPISTAIALFAVIITYRGSLKSAPGQLANGFLSLFYKPGVIPDVEGGRKDKEFEAGDYTNSSGSRSATRLGGR